MIQSMKLGRLAAALLTLSLITPLGGCIGGGGGGSTAAPTTAPEVTLNYGIKSLAFS